MIDLSIIIVNWNTCALLCQCLRSIEQTIDGIAYEIIVVDNASSDDSLAVVRVEFPHIRLIANPENLGFARANNQGVRISRGQYLMLLNSDTVVLPGAFHMLVRFLRQHPDVGIVGPELLNGDGTVQPSWAQFPTLWSEFRGANIRTRSTYTTHDGAEAYCVDWIGGACLLIRDTVIEQIGLLDERFFMYAEETDWCLRAKQKGWFVGYYPPAQVIHYGGQSSRKASARMKAQLYRSKLLFFAKHYGAAYSLLLGSALQLLFLVRTLIAWLMLVSGSRSRAGTPSLYQEALEAFRIVRQPLQKD